MQHELSRKTAAMRASRTSAGCFGGVPLPGCALLRCVSMKTNAAQRNSIVSGLIQTTTTFFKGIGTVNDGVC